MARPGGEQTRASIREAVRAIIAESGVETCTLDAVAERVGVTRQAVLYHFKSRDRLMADAFLELLAHESEAMCAAAEATEPGLAGAGGFMERALDWYLEDPNRFRMIYALSQVSSLLPALHEDVMEERVYPVTGQIYAALEKRLSDGPLPDGVDPRKLGIALHMCTLGMACYEGMLDRAGERFAHDWHEVAGALAKAMAR